MELKKALAELVGNECVDDSPESLFRYSRDHSLVAVGAEPDIIVHPVTAAHVEKIMGLANRLKVAVIPVSSSVHFDGNTLPKMGGIILDMRKMNRVLNIDLDERLARIEAGVTWAQIQTELQKHQQRMIMPLMPLSSGSVISSLLGREVATNSRYEFSEPLTSMEVIWGNGMRFRTGSASTPGFPDKSICKGGTPQGPGTDWYRFLQGADGTMGVVTWGIVKLEYLPLVDEAYFMAFDSIQDAIDPLYRIQRSMIGNECFLINNQVAAFIFQEKWPDDYQRLLQILPPWLLVGVLSGPKRFPEEKVAYEKEALDEIASQIPSIQEVMTSLPGIPGLEKRLPQKLRNPWPEERTFWKHQLKGSCQDLFFIAKMEEAPRFTETVIKVAGSYGYDVDSLGIHLQPIEYGRACRLEYQFYYDPEDEKAKQRVKSIYTEAAKALFKDGAFFSRPSVLISPMVYDHCTAYTATLKNVKGVLDPNYILSPGNVCF